MIEIDETKLGDKEYWEILFKTPEDKFKKKKKQSKYDLIKECYDKAPNHIRLDKNWVLDAIFKNHLHIFSVDNSLKDEDFCREYVEKDNYPSLYGMPLIYQRKFVDKAMEKYSYNLSNLYHEKELKDLITKENILKWISLNPSIYLETQKYHPLKNEFAFAEVAAKNDHKLLSKMSKSIAKKIVNRNLEIMLNYFEKDITLFDLFPLKLRNNKEFILKHIDRLRSSQMELIGEKALDKDVILKMTGFYNVDIPEKLKQDKEIALHVVSTTYHKYVEFIDCENFTQIEIIRESLKRTTSVNMYKSLSEELKKEENIILALLEIGYYKDSRSVTKAYNFQNYYFEKKEFELFDNSVVNLLPDEIKISLNENFIEKSNGRSPVDQDELLKFARGTYLQICLEKQLKKEKELKSKKLKI